MLDVVRKVRCQNRVNRYLKYCEVTTYCLQIKGCSLSQGAQPIDKASRLPEKLRESNCQHSALHPSSTIVSSGRAVVVLVDVEVREVWLGVFPWSCSLGFASRFCYRPPGPLL